MSTNLTNISVQQLKRAIVVREQIEALEHELAAILGESHSGAKGPGGRRTMSAAARAKIAAAQRARWARQKGHAVSDKPRRTMSAAARAKIAAAARARWAKAKAANRKTLKTP
jgi:hypothetical protein